MKATKLLTQQHQEVATLFKKFDDAEGDEERAALFEEIGAKLAAHDAIEREIFYPACKAALGEEGEEMLGEALVEHGVVEFSIYKADIADAETLAHCVTVLADIVEHHVEEEEDELFPLVEEAMESAQLEELGAQMEARFEAALQEEFRVAVRANLEQVLAGAIETVPDAAAAAAVDDEEDDDDEDEDEDEDEDDEDGDEEDDGEDGDDGDDEGRPVAKKSAASAKKTAPAKKATPAKKAAAKPAAKKTPRK